MAKVFITKYALSEGIQEIDAVIYEINPNVIYVYYNCQFFCIGKSAFLDKADAIKKAKEMRKKKIASLKKQISKLEKMTF